MVVGTSRIFWEGFAPSVLQRQGDDGGLSTVFRVEEDSIAAHSHRHELSCNSIWISQDASASTCTQLLKGH